MSSSFAFTLLFSVCAFGLGIAIPAFPHEDRCGPNAFFNECGSACAPTCKNPNPGPICTLQCVIGCFCNEGYLKNEKGECVRPQECDGQTHHKIAMQIPSAFPSCPEHEEFQACGSACAPNCANPHPSPMCTKNCVIGCFCKSGYLRNAKGVCVPASQCEAKENVQLFAYPPEMTQCKENEIFLSCGSACAPTCANPHPGPACTLQCVIGCFCKPGFLKNSQGVCVPAEECGVPAEMAMPLPPQICKSNEEFRQCKGCDGTCDNPNPPCPRICIPGCACKKGHLRTGPNGMCIPQEQCPKTDAVQMMMMPPVPKCPAHEVFRPCGTACPATCANPHPSPVCTKNCVIGCFCQEGYLRNANGVCVPAANCDAPKVEEKPESKCASDREFYVEECGSQVDCMSTCHVPPAFLIRGVPQIPKKCLERMCAPSCVCKHPYVRNADGKCVERSECDAVPMTTVPSA